MISEEINRWVQKGENPKYPKFIETWKVGQDVPEWLSDIAKITGMTGDSGKVSIELRETNTGGYEIIDSSGKYTLVKAKNRGDYICFVPGQKLFSLSELQVNLIYKREKK